MVRLSILTALLVLALLCSPSTSKTPATPAASEANLAKIKHFYDLISNESYRIMMANKDKLNMYTTIDPHAKTYGGFGNLMTSFYSSIMIGLATNRPFINNIPLLNALFDHPDNRQTWKLKKPDEVFKEAPEIKQFAAGGNSSICNDLRYNRIHLDQVPSKIGINRCWMQSIQNKEMNKKFTDLFDMTSLTKEDPSIVVSYDSELSEMLGGWSVSKPTPLFKQLGDDYERFLLGQCGAAGTIDFAIQFRSWRDQIGEKSFEAAGGKCVLDCSLGRLEALHERTKRDLCVFITSDNDKYSKELGIRLKEKLSYVKPATGVDYRKINTTVNDEWHLVKLIDRTRHSIDEKEIGLHTELLDWYALGDASEALITSSSTFASSARIRNSMYEQLNHLHDYIYEGAFALGPGKCTCKEWSFQLGRRSKRS